MGWRLEDSSARWGARIIDTGSLDKLKITWIRAVGAGIPNGDLSIVDHEGHRIVWDEARRTWSEK